MFSCRRPTPILPAPAAHRFGGPCFQRQSICFAKWKDCAGTGGHSPFFMAWQCIVRTQPRDASAGPAGPGQFEALSGRLRARRRSAAGLDGAEEPALDDRRVKQEERKIPALRHDQRSGASRHQPGRSVIRPAHIQRRVGGVRPGEIRHLDGALCKRSLVPAHGGHCLIRRERG